MHYKLLKQQPKRSSDLILVTAGDKTLCAIGNRS